MQGRADRNATVESSEPNDKYDSIVSHLASLIDHVQTCTKLIESAIGSEAFPGDEYLAPDVAVLDDVTPRYATASAALNTCRSSLGMALRCLLDTGTPRRGTADGGFSSGDPSGFRRSLRPRGPG
jgi:hypothetical protein